MPSKKLSKRFKIEIAVVAFAVTSYLLFLGFDFISQKIQFRPYKKLAGEISQSLGGGFSESDTWNCGLETPNCPSVHLVKPQKMSEQTARNDLINHKAYFQKNYYNNVKIGTCDVSDDFGYCFASAVDSKQNIEITISEKSDGIRVDIGRP